MTGSIQSERLSDEQPDFRILFESAPGLYLVLSPELRIVGASEAYLQATMTRREGILGRPLFEVFPDNPADAGATGTRNLRASLERVLSSRAPDAMAVQKYDIRRPASEGGGFEERFWSPLNSPVLGPNGDVRYIIHRVEDVTNFIRLKQTESEQAKAAEEFRTRALQMEAETSQRTQQLQDANEKFRTANLSLRENVLHLEQAQRELLFQRSTLDRAGILSETDVHGTITHANDEFCRISGYSREELIGQNHRMLNSGFHPLEFWREMFTTLARAGVWQGLVCNRAKNGSLYWVQSTNVAFRDEHNRIVRYVSLRTDVTEHVRAQESLRDRDERMASIVEHSDDAIISEDLTGTVTSWNAGAARLFGYSAQEMVGQSLLALVPPEKTQEWSAFKKRLHNGERVVRDETVRVTKDGRRLDIALTLSPFKDGKGRIVGVSKIARDITESKRAEEALRAATLAAESANRAKSDFLAHMSHEIRTPLNGVIGMLELLQSTDLNDAQRRYSTLARSSAELLTTVINDILDFSKIEAGKLEIVPAEFNLHDAAEEVVAMLAQKAARKGLEIACHIEAGVPVLVEGDADRVRQVLINLVGNAIKFTERGEVVVRLALESGRGSRVRFTVQDTGIGILPDRMTRLFRAFSQADASTTRVYGGTGLGLVISKQLVELMGGQIGAESQTGLGSLFWFVLPFDLITRDDGPELANRLDPRALRVLAVDDSAVQRDILRQQISSWGLEATAAESGERALVLLSGAAGAGAPFRVAIVDSDMPGMDGFEFAREVKRRADIDQTVLMILLSVESGIAPERLRELGFAGQMTKPVRQSQLFDAIMNAIAASETSGNGFAHPEQSALPGPKPTSEPNHAGARILIAEDNEINRIVVTETLSKFGYVCEAVTDGRQAVEAIKLREYDLVIMDCQMPVMDGFEATRAIREYERAGDRHIPIIALTANAMKGDRERCLAAGMDAYSSKPIHPVRLMDAIKSLLHTNEAGTTRDAGEEPPPVDIGALINQCLSNLSLVSRLLTTFEDEARRGLTEVTQGVQSGDAVRVTRAAHALTGAAGVMFAKGISRAASDIEMLARAGNMEAVSSRLIPLHDAVQKCLVYLPTAIERVDAESQKGIRK